MKEKLKEILTATKGQFFTVVFTKKDGSDRVMNCRLGVTKHLKGGEKKVTQDNYLTVFDLQKEGYRTINLDTVKSLKLGGTEFIVNDEKVFKKVD